VDKALDIASPAQAPAHPEGEVLPVAAPCGAFEGGVWFARGEYLLMEPRRRALDFAIVDPNTDGNPQGRIESLDWEYSSGFRVGGGYRLQPDGLEVGAYYTYLYSHTNRGLEAPAGGTLYATLTHPGFVDAVNTAAASASLNYHLVDLELGRRWVLGESFQLWAGGGGRFASIRQSLTAVYDGQTAFLDRVSSPVRFDGAGLRAGAEGTWLMGRGFSLFSRLYGSLVLGDLRTSLEETNGAGTLSIADVDERVWQVVPVVELAVGIGWQRDWLRARVAYEITNWFGLVDSPDFVHDFTNKLGRRESDLSLDGLAAELEVTY
jgi:hypothetical protein